MQIVTADFLVSNTSHANCPSPDKPEYAFVGRSNVGKSSLINMITGKKGLAKTSSTPGKTQLINHFLINNEWYIVDLPGLGYAKVAKAQRKVFHNTVVTYLKGRENLLTTFILVDSRIPPQKIDIDMIDWMGENRLPFVVLFTKTDALTKNAFKIQLQNFQNKLGESWEEMPLIISTSSNTGRGRSEIIDYMDSTNQLFRR